MTNEIKQASLKVIDMLFFNDISTIHIANNLIEELEIFIKNEIDKYESLINKTTEFILDDIEKAIYYHYILCRIELVLHFDTDGIFEKISAFRYKKGLSNLHPKRLIEASSKVRYDMHTHIRHSLISIFQNNATHVQFIGHLPDITKNILEFIFKNFKKDEIFLFKSNLTGLALSKNFSTSYSVDNKEIPNIKYPSSSILFYKYLIGKKLKAKEVINYNKIFIIRVYLLIEFEIFKRETYRTRSSMTNLHEKIKNITDQHFINIKNVLKLDSSFNHKMLEMISNQTDEFQKKVQESYDLNKIEITPYLPMVDITDIIENETLPKSIILDFGNVLSSKPLFCINKITCVPKLGALIVFDKFLKNNSKNKAVFNGLNYDLCSDAVDEMSKHGFTISAKMINKNFSQMKKTSIFNIPKYYLETKALGIEPKLLIDDPDYIYKMVMETHYDHRMYVYHKDINFWTKGLIDAK